MSLISRIFGQKQRLPPSIDHPVFGTMDATLSVGTDAFFWETPGCVNTANGAISVFCDAPSSGPTNDQVWQFEQICGTIAAFTEASRQLLLDRLRDFQSEDQIDNLRLSSALLAFDGRMSSHWELTFEEPRSRRLFNVNFDNGDAVLVTVDD